VKTAREKVERDLVVRSSRHGRQRAFWLPGGITADKRGSISLNLRMYSITVQSALERFQ
jgi:hypothetical protein